MQAGKGPSTARPPSHTALGPRVPTQPQGHTLLPLHPSAEPLQWRERPPQPFHTAPPTALQGSLFKSRNKTLKMLVFDPHAHLLCKVEKCEPYRVSCLPQAFPSSLGPKATLPPLPQLRGQPLLEGQEVACQSESRVARCPHQPAPAPRLGAFLLEPTGVGSGLLPGLRELEYSLFLPASKGPGQRSPHKPELTAITWAACICAPRLHRTGPRLLLPL